jgi:hypothetical protein
MTVGGGQRRVSAGRARCRNHKVSGDLWEGVTFLDVVALEVAIA